MTNATLRGKPDAGNPHVRFDEGEVASVKPRRGSLLYGINAWIVFASLFAAVSYETIDKYFWQAEVPLIRHLRLTTNDTGRVIKPVAFTTIYVDHSPSEEDENFVFITVDLQNEPELTTIFVPSGCTVRISQDTTNRFVVGAGVTNDAIDRVVQVRNVGPSRYLMTELRTQ